MQLKTDRPRGVLGAMTSPKIRHERFHPSGATATLVEHFWAVTWHLDGQPDQHVATLPHPSVHLVFEPGATALTGVHRGRFSRVLHGNSFVFGVKFKPASFRAFYGGDLSSLTDRVIDPRRVLGADFAALDARMLAARTNQRRAAIVDEYLRRRLPARDPMAERLNGWVAQIAADRSLNRVEQLAGLCGCGVRQLQRLFAAYIGVSPKWIIARYRIHEALAHAQAHQRIGWAALAHDLGYADQAHFIRDFKLYVGKTPSAYVRACRRQGEG